MKSWPYYRKVNNSKSIEFSQPCGDRRGGEARLWLAEKSAYDVWQAAQRFLDTLMQVSALELNGTRRVLLDKPLLG